MLAGEPDERLVALARAGDERAFDAIVERYRAPLERYIRGYLPAAGADDALQQAFINAYAALTSQTAKAPASLRPWLYRVAHNAALNVARDPQAALSPLPEGLDGVERPDEALQRSERLRAVVAAVRALPAKQRQVIVRHALDGDSHEQIAADLGVSAGAIRQLAHRARRTVREAATAAIPVPVLRWLPWGLAESAPVLGGSGTAARLVAAVVATAVAGGGAVEVARLDRERAPRRADVAVRVQPPARDRAAADEPATALAVAIRRVPRTAPVTPIPAVDRRSSRSGHGSGSSDAPSGDGSSGSGSGDDSSSGSGTSGGGSDDSSGRGSSGSATDVSSGSGSSGSGSSGEPVYDSSGSGSSGSNSSGEPVYDSSGSGSSGSGSSGEPVYDSSGSGSSGELVYDSSGSGSGSSGSGSSGSGSSGSGSSGSGSSGSG